MLPKYCVDTMGFGYGDAYTNTSPKAGYWLGLMGKSFWAMHHHCFGLIKLRRATSGLVSAQARLGYLQGAVGEFEYVLRNAKPDFIMLPEVNLRLGDTLVQLKNYGAAQTAYDRAIRQNPNFAPPYARWAEVQEKIGNKKGALAFLEEGLRHAPASAELLAQYRRMGGNADVFLKSLPRQAEVSASAPEAEPSKANPAPAPAPADPAVPAASR